jgi:transcriptional regulator with XRE-family HTH domain
MLRESLSLNMTQLARGLGVGRAALYGWLSDARTPRLKHLARLRELYDVASYWRRLSSKPLGKYLIMPLNNGNSIARLLTKSPLPMTEIKSALEAVASEILASETRKRSSGYRSVASVMAERGYKPLPGDDTRSLDLDDLVT